MTRIGKINESILSAFSAKPSTTKPPVFSSKLPGFDVGRVFSQASQSSLGDVIKTWWQRKEVESAAPKVTIEGLSISSGLSPVTQDTGSSGRSVSIVQESTNSSLKRLIIEKMVGPQPVILSFTKVPSLSVSEIDSFLEVSQFERELIKEAVEIGIDRVKRELLQSQGKSAEEEMTRLLKLADDRISALAYMREVMTEATSGLNVAKMSPQIMQKAASALSQILVSTEASNPALPGAIDEYISLTFPFSSIDKYLTNTSRLAIIAQDMLQSCLSSHPTVLSNFSRGDIADLRVLFSVPGAFSYDPDGDSSTKNDKPVPTVLELFSRNSSRSTIKGQFSASSAGPRSLTRLNPGFITITRSTAGSGDEMWDDILHSICSLSNEMVLSSGIGRLQGSRLGGRFLEKNPSNPLQFDPFIRVLGFRPTAGPETVANFYKSGPDRQGSLLDYLALGEEAENEEFVVMPFEVNTVEHNNKLYVAGRQYFIELPLQSELPTLPGAVQEYSSRFSLFTRDVSSYMTELMALDVNTPLSPESLMSRVLQDFEGAITSLTDDSITSQDKKSALVAALFSQCGFHDKSKVKLSQGNSSREILVSDVLKMSIIKSLKDLDPLLEDKTYFLSRDASDYSVLDTAENPEIALTSAVVALDGVESSNPLDNGALDNLVQHRIDANSFSFLHDKNFQSRSNLINLIAITIREIQREALNLAQRGGASSDYRNSSGGTNMSNCDEDRLVDIVATVYMNLAYLLFPVTLLSQGRVRYSRENALRCAALLSDVRGALVNGSPMSVNDIRQRLGIDEGTPVSLSPSGDNTEVSTPASIVDALSRLPRHRYYIKSSLKILEAVSSCITATSSKVSSVFSIIQGTSDRKGLKGNDAVLYDMFIQEKDRFLDLRKNLTESQLNLLIQSKKIYGEPGEVRMRSDIDVSPSERLALRDFIRSCYEKSDIGDLHIVSVGIPSGLLDTLYNPALETGLTGAVDVAAQGTETDDRRRYIRVELDRFDNVYSNTVSTVMTNVMRKPPSAIATPSETEFDAEIFILPGSIQYNPKAWPSGALSVMDAILRSTTFYRIRGGKIIEVIGGDRVPDIEVARYANTLRSYLLDLFMYDAAGIRQYDGTSPVGAPTLNSSGLSFIKAASENEIAARSLMLRPGFYRAFNPKTGRLKESTALRSLLVPTSDFSSPEFTREDVKFAAVLACISPLCDTSDIVRFRPYERIYHFFYDESVIRNQIPGDTLEIKFGRRNFDIYSLSSRIVFGGGSSGT